MLGIITNEKDMLEKILRTKRIDETNPLSDVRLVVKYQMSQGIDDSEVIYYSVNELMKCGYEGYNEVVWEKTIKKLIGSVKKYKSFDLINIDEIIITKAEWESIIALNDKQLERLAFIMLCYAKIGNKVYPNSDNWVYSEITNIFKESKIRAGFESHSLFYKLIKENNYLYRVNNAKANGFRVNFINEESEPFIRINDFRDKECITYYEEYKGIKKYKVCEVCGKRFEIKSKTYKPKYCNVCAKTIKLEQNKKSYNKNK